MEELEDPTESLHEHIHEGAHHAAAEGNNWVIFVALTTAIIAVLSAITGLLAAYHADESMLSQIHASDQWAYYQAKGIKTDVLISEVKIFKALGKTPDSADVAKIKDNKKQQEEISATAKEAETESHEHVARHNVLARAVTLFQISIAISAIAILVKRKLFWFVSLGFAGVALFFFITGIL